MLSKKKKDHRDQLLLEVLVAAKVREEQLVLRVQRRALAKDAKVEVVGRLDEASAAAPASGHRDEDMGRRYGFIQLDDRKHLHALRDVDCGRQARHKWDLEAAHRLDFVFSDVPGHLDLLHSVGRRQTFPARPDASI